MKKAIVYLTAGVFAAACSKDKSADPALSNDLSLAAQARQTAALDSVTAIERARAVRESTTHVAVVHHATTTREYRSSGGGNAASTEHTVTEKNTNRDAVIGGAAGALIGGVAGHSVKSGVIGAAAGAILGGVVGNNVDIKKKKVP